MTTLKSKQMTLPFFRDMLANPNAQAVGMYGEHTAAALLERSGYHVSHTQPGEHRGDLLVVNRETGELITVEVKTARWRSERYGFCLRRGTKTDVRYADVLMLLFALKTGHVVPFVIPVRAVRNIQYLSIHSHPSDYNGKWARYRQSANNLCLEAVL